MKTDSKFYISPEATQIEAVCLRVIATSNGISLNGPDKWGWEGDEQLI